MDLKTLARSVLKDLEIYRYDVPAGSVGSAWSPEKLETQLAEMRAALVAPYWTDVELRDSHEQIAARPLVRRRCAIVADDSKGMLVAFDPIEGEFFLATRHDAQLITIGVRGDAVGCFLSR